MEIKLSCSSGEIPDGDRISRKNFSFTGRIFYTCLLKDRHASKWQSQEGVSFSNRLFASVYADIAAISIN